MAAVGIRVMRGPDWSGGDVDGGEGHLGTITSYAEDKTCTVIWDNGKVTISSAGKGNKFDLRIVDNAPIGVRHNDKVCNGCGEKDIIGIRWSCKKCEDLHLCSLCYFMGKHDRSHDFDRHDTAKSEGSLVLGRFTTSNIQTYGIFPSAVVTRGMHCDQDDKDGGPDKRGTVTGVISHDSKSYRSAVTVAWERGETTTCRVGHQGQVDVQCIEPALGPQCYPQHLPAVDADVVKLWNELDEGKNGSSSKTKFKKGGAVRILDDKQKVKRLQKDHGEWTEEMTQFLGKVGRVVKVLDDGDVVVRFGILRFCYNPACCLPASESDLLSDPLGLKAGLDSVNEELPSDPLGTLSKLAESCKQSLENLSGVKATKADGADEFLTALKKSDVDEIKKILDKYPFLIKCQPANGVTLLHAAANEGKLEVVQFLLDMGADIDAIDSQGHTPLLVSLDKKHLDVATFLIQAGTDLDVVNDDGLGILHFAVHAGDPPLVHNLMRRGCDVNAVAINGDTPLHFAILANQFSCAEILLTSPNLDLTITSEKGFNPLHFDALVGNSGGKLTKKILKRNKELLNKQNKDGHTALHIAVVKNHKQEAEILIKEGADVNIKDKENEATPLHYACKKGHYLFAKMFLSAGAEVNAEDVNKDTPLHVVMKTSENKEDEDSSDDSDDELLPGLKSFLKKSISKLNVSVQRRIQLATLLLEHGADVNVKNKDEKTPLDVCMNQSLKKAVVDFQTRGKTESGETAECSPGSLLCCECFKREAEVECLSCKQKMICNECAEVVKTCPICTVSETGEPAASSSSN